MCGNYFNINAARNSIPPQPPLDGYHVHIYFEAGKESETNALEVSRQIAKFFPDAVDDIHRIGKAGPHLQPNIAVAIKPESFGEVVGWLQRNSKGLSILVHPESGDDLKDHLESTLWLGKPVPLNLAFFLPPAPKGPKQ